MGSKLEAALQAVAARLLVEVRMAGGEASIERLLALSGPAYRLAVRTVGSHEDAEDVVQQAYLAAVKKIRQASPPIEARSWFLKVVLNTAKYHLRSEATRRRREAALESDGRSVSGPSAGLTSALAGALAMLDDKHRLAVSLCYEEGLSQREAAGILEMPERTVSKYVNVGLAKLRKALERAGYPAAVAAVLGSLKQTAPVVPASLAGRVKALVSSGAEAEPRKFASRAARRRSAAKGGITMKVIVGVVLAGSIAAGVAMLSGGGSEAKPLPAETPKKKFSIPVWHPDARWERDARYFCGFREVVQGGELDGPRKEIMHCHGAGPGLPISRMTQGGRSVFLSYDEGTERFHTTAGSAHGCLDGPFSRARFQGTDYVKHGHLLRSPGNRYGYYVSAFDYKVRLLDLEKQEVRTIFTDRGLYNASMTVDNAGRLLLLKGSDLRFMNREGKVERTVPLKGEQPRDLFGARGGSGVRLAYDEVHDRLYGCSAQKRLWYVGYWDLKDGSFHGLVPVPQKGKPNRGRTGAGPFEGAGFYGEGSICFGPDDPEKRFLYMGQTDTWTGFRLDLKKRKIWALSEEEKGIFSFIGTGNPKTGGRQVAYSGTGVIWALNGNDFFGYVGDGYARYKRVK